MWGVCDVEDKQTRGPVFLDTPWELMPLSLFLYLMSLQPAEEQPASHSYTPPPPFSFNGWGPPILQHSR